MKKSVSCGSSDIHLLSIFETLGQKLEFFLSIFCGTKITLEWIYPPPQLCLTHPLLPKYFEPPLLSILKSRYPHLQLGGSGYAFIFFYCFVFLDLLICYYFSFSLCCNVMISLILLLPLSSLSI